MIGSFWNLCRACPSMPVDKLHSEYRSTYRWHEYTGNSKPEVVRKPPIPNQFASSTEHFFSKSMEDEKTTEGPFNEPPLPRRKKCPELAYKTHEFIIGTDGPIPNLRNDNSSITRARSEERGKSSRRSKSEGPPGIANGTAYPIPCDNDVIGVKANGNVQAGESSGLFKKTITKLSTEYRLQFVWPHVRKAIKGDTNDAVDLPRKSLSMGAIKSSQTNALPTVHKKRTANEKEATVYELEPLVNDVEEKKVIEKPPIPAERKSTRPFSQALDSERQNQFITRKENYGFKEEKEKEREREREKTGVEEALKHVNDTVVNKDNKTMVNGTGVCGQEWYKEVIELRKKAGEYKCRGWGIEIDPELYKKQRDLWDQVSRRSSLSALSLASSIHRPITKEEKEQENNKKSSPTKNASRARVPGQAHFVDNKIMPDGPILPARVQTIRHHLERTTGPDVEEGALLPSPTREKLMPAIPKSKENEQYSSQRGSPKKTAASRHGSPQKGSPQKGSPKKTIKGRSQSVGPAVIDSNESPKRQNRSISTAPTTATTTTPPTATVSTIKAHKKTPASTPTTGERRPRPSTLSTTIHSRSKSSSLPPTSGRAHSAPGNHHHHIQLSHNDTNKTSTIRKTNKSSKQLRPKSAIIVNQNATIASIPASSTTAATTATTTTDSSTICDDGQRMTMKGQDKKLAENDDDKDEKEGGVSLSSPHQPPEQIPEHIVKSPPEPTRVKSPEQIIMRSPDPVNWTVPLDTGKTFTVTQNVKEGENYSRPQSEFKASTPIERPPPAPQSAPPELAEQAKSEGWKNSDRSEISESETTASPSKSIVVPEVRYDKPIPGSTLRCLDDPTYDIDQSNIATTIGQTTTTPSSTSSSIAAPRNLATDALEKARERFDRFWGGNKEENV